MFGTVCPNLYIIKYVTILSESGAVVHAPRTYKPQKKKKTTT